MQSYLSQSFRNKRRYSEPIKKPSSKIAAKENAVMVATEATVQKPRKYDKVGYDRDMKSLSKEIVKEDRNQCDICITINNLLSLTHEQRRLLINCCLIRMTDILADFPFFRHFKWI